MEQNKAENYVVFINRDLIRNLAIYSVGLMAIYYVSFTFVDLLLPAIGLTGYLGSNLLILLFNGLRLPGYQQALAKYTTDKVGKKAMIDNYQAIKATKPFALVRTYHLISLAVGVLSAFAVYLSMAPAL
jgi:uncharacterized RDD family membrane protein YckC